MMKARFTFGLPQLPRFGDNQDSQDRGARNGSTGGSEGHLKEGQLNGAFHSGPFQDGPSFNGPSHKGGRIPDDEILADFPRPLLFGHRGMPCLYPENTMASFRAACDAGVPGIELDVHLTKDGRLIVFHDDTTERIGGSGNSRSGGQGEPALPAFFRLEETDSETLRSLDIGSWKGSEFLGERMPFLDEVFEEFGQRAYFDVEIKSRSTESKGLEPLLAATIRKYHMEKRCVVSSFNPFALKWMKRIMPALPSALIYTSSKDLYWFLRHGEGRFLAPVDILKPDTRLVRTKRGATYSAEISKIAASARPVARAKARPFLPWTVDSVEEAKRVLASGAMGVISNRPQDLLGLCC